jgi:hypothetical protein
VTLAPSPVAALPPVVGILVYAALGVLVLRFALRLAAEATREPRE